MSLAVLPASAAGADRVLRVVTFNLLHGGPSSGWSGDADRLEARLAIAVDELRRLAPDVIALQEASVGRGRGHVAARIAAALGLHYAHAPATSRVFGLPPLGWLLVRAMNFEEGPAVLSRYPIAASEIHDLPRCRSLLDPRVALRVVLSLPEGSLPVISTHISHDGCQARRVADIAAAARGTLPALLMGDFNAAERTPWLEALMRDHGLVDAYRAANPEGDGATVWQPVRAPERRAFRRVDYVFIAPGTRYTTRVLASRVVLDSPRRLEDGDTLWPSDHYGVLAELRLAARPTG